MTYGGSNVSAGAMWRALERVEEHLRLRRAADREAVLAEIRRDPVRLMAAANLDPDPWQASVLHSAADRMLLLCSRQAGKSTVSSALAVHTALTKPNAPVLLLSPSQRQSGELFRKVLNLYGALGHPVPAVRETALQLELANGSRILSLPGTEGTIRGFSEVALLVIDEAARVSDSLYYAVRPMLAVSKGRLVALSTPFGQRGWFYEEWRGTGSWERVRITADQVPRITSEFLAEERKALGDRWFNQEFACSFESTTDAVFDPEDIRRALSDDVQPLFPVR
jgi:hypothetical protein